MYESYIFEAAWLKISSFHSHRWQIRLSISKKHHNENIFSPSCPSVIITSILPVVHALRLSLSHIWGLPHSFISSPNICQILCPATFPFCTISTQKLPPRSGNGSVTGVPASLSWFIMHSLISPGKARGWSHSLSKGLIYPTSSQETKLKTWEENTER